MKALLIPVKDPAGAKTRLAEVLSSDERRRLAWAMFEDVTEAVALAAMPDHVAVVTSFAPAAERAHGFGWDVLLEESQVSESASVDWASRVLAERGFDVVMRLPADVPLVRAEDIDRLLAVELGDCGAVLVPSRDGTGTNAVIRKPPALFPSRFGPNSLALHKEEAARLGVGCLIVENQRLALDLDAPEDLESFLKRGNGTRTFDLLLETSFTRKVIGDVTGRRA
ncbi:MAG TPA: 2-phospho-L-lactate guanylyltransferase [Blastocatellia bacterium]|nr:2-phospho-L-lactate guanylyltransferase [Blastocatellia bacterium]